MPALIINELTCYGTFPSLLQNLFEVAGKNTNTLLFYLERKKKLSELLKNFIRIFIYLVKITERYLTLLSTGVVNS
jgi:hypothetical protein